MTAKKGFKKLSISCIGSSIFTVVTETFSFVSKRSIILYVNESYASMYTTGDGTCTLITTIYQQKSKGWDKEGKMTSMDFNKI